MSVWLARSALCLLSPAVMCRFPEALMKGSLFGSRENTAANDIICYKDGNTEIKRGFIFIYSVQGTAKKQGKHLH